MGIFDKLRNEFVDIIEWLSDDHHTVVWRFPRYQNEIKNGAQLIVRPGQAAVFVHQGELADIFTEGRHELTTDNLPILSTLMGWSHGFNSPFRSEVYFVSTKQITDLKWGTPKPIMMRDSDFGRLRIRAFGTYGLRVIDPKIVIRELVGTDSQFEANELTELLRAIIQSTFAEILGEAKIPALDLAAKYGELSDKLRSDVCEKIDDEYGLEVPFLTIVNISLPEAVEKALDQSSSMAALGDMNQYQQYQMANALNSAAQNPAAGGMGAGMGMGMGMAMANQMGNMANTPRSAAPVAPPPPPLPQQTMWHLSNDGHNAGPMNSAQLQQALAQGQLTPTTLVWSAGMSGWQPAAQVPQLSPLFQAAAPPPLPPPQ
jgi:membrane protease subunit (stomatin/prohibitin family)